MALKFGDAYSLAMRDEARTKATVLEMFPLRAIDWLARYYEP